MTLSPAGISVALLAASGFDEHGLTEVQRALIKAGITSKIISPENGVINGWQGQNWGHYFPVQLQIQEALGSDFDALILAGGERSTTKLKSNLHARRIINHFLEAQKPIAAFETGVTLLTLSSLIKDLLVAAPATVHEELKAAGAQVAEDNLVLDHHVLTSDGSDMPIFIEKAIALFTTQDIEAQAA